MIIVVSSPGPVKDEFKIIHQLFEQGLQCFHLYKPAYSLEQIADFLQRISAEHHGKIEIHEDAYKFHSLKEMENCKEEYEYAFLSPVFDSISKFRYKSNFDLKEVGNFLKNKKEKIIALGGIDEDKIETVRELGFSGIALLGAIWQDDKPAEKFERIKEKWLENGITY